MDFRDLVIFTKSGQKFFFFLEWCQMTRKQVFFAFRAFFFQNFFRGLANIKFFCKKTSKKLKSLEMSKNHKSIVILTFWAYFSSFYATKFRKIFFFSKIMKKVKNFKMFKYQLSSVILIFWAYFSTFYATKRHIH